uniref:Uncharacterized protein n=1 Tax=Anopheles albimanus TaxID=7167 RepID=A0A182FXD6_ANOAL
MKYGKQYARRHRREFELEQTTERKFIARSWLSNHVYGAGYTPGRMHPNPAIEWLRQLLLLLQSIRCSVLWQSIRDLTVSGIRCYGPDEFLRQCFPRTTIPNGYRFSVCN